MTSPSVGPQIREAFPWPRAAADGPAVLRWHPWTITRGEWLAREHLVFPGDGRWPRFAGAFELWGVRMHGAGAWGPREDRPLLQLAYEVALSGGWHRAEAFDAACAMLDAHWGLRGQRRAFALHPHIPARGQVRAQCEWVLGPVRLLASSWAEPREGTPAGSGATSGALSLALDESHAAAPFRRREAEAELVAPRGATIVHRVSLPELRASGLSPDLDAEARADFFALYRPECRPTPPWLAEGLDADELVRWQQSDGRWGLANRDCELRLDGGASLRFRHVRLAPARGPGGASLEWIDPEGRAVGLWSSRGRAEAFDAVAEDLRSVGASVELSEWVDD